jgi:hypothetical protein
MGVLNQKMLAPCPVCLDTNTGEGGGPFHYSRTCVNCGFKLVASDMSSSQFEKLEARVNTAWDYPLSTDPEIRSVESLTDKVDILKIRLSGFLINNIHVDVDDYLIRFDSKTTVGVEYIAFANKVELIENVILHNRGRIPNKFWQELTMSGNEDKIKRNEHGINRPKYGVGDRVYVSALCEAGLAKRSLIFRIFNTTVKTVTSEKNDQGIVGTHYRLNIDFESFGISGRTMMWSEAEVFDDIPSFACALPIVVADGEV